MTTFNRRLAAALIALFAAHASADSRVDEGYRWVPVSGTGVHYFAAGTLVNTGHQVFSGTVLGSAPVLIHDDSFRFDVNLFTGETKGQVFFDDPIAGPRIRCRLEIVGTGQTEAGDAAVSYTGWCRVRDLEAPRQDDGMWR